MEGLYALRYLYFVGYFPIGIVEMKKDKDYVIYPFIYKRSLSEEPNEIEFFGYDFYRYQENDMFVKRLRELIDPSKYVLTSYALIQESGFRYYLASKVDRLKDYRLYTALTINVEEKDRRDKMHKIFLTLFDAFYTEEMSKRLVEFLESKSIRYNGKLVPLFKLDDKKGLRVLLEILQDYPLDEELLEKLKEKALFLFLRDLISVRGSEVTTLVSKAESLPFSETKATKSRYSNSRRKFNGVTIEDYFIQKILDKDGPIIDLDEVEEELGEGGVAAIKSLGVLVPIKEEHLDEDGMIRVCKRCGSPVISIERFKELKGLSDEHIKILTVREPNAKYICTRCLELYSDTGKKPIETLPEEARKKVAERRLYYIHPSVISSYIKGNLSTKNIREALERLVDGDVIVVDRDSIKKEGIYISEVDLAIRVPGKKPKFGIVEVKNKKYLSPREAVKYLYNRRPENISSYMIKRISLDEAKRLTVKMFFIDASYNIGGKDSQYIKDVESVKAFFKDVLKKKFEEELRERLKKKVKMYFEYFTLYDMLDFYRRERLKRSEASDLLSRIIANAIYKKLNE